MSKYPATQLPKRTTGLMSVEMTCVQCGKLLRLNAKLMGKRIKCPQCQAVLRVPLTELWHVKTDDEQHFGPIPKSELDEWVADGRLNTTCQVLRDGRDQWQWADDVYPELATAEAAAAAGAAAEGSAGHSPDASTADAPLLGGETTEQTGSETCRTGGVEPGQWSDRSRMTAGLLGIFLGPLGMHRIYLGYVVLGLVMLATGGGCGVWSLIDAIMVLSGKIPDAQGRPLR